MKQVWLANTAKLLVWSVDVEWISEDGKQAKKLLSPGKSFGNLIENFHLTREDALNKMVAEIKTERKYLRNREAVLIEKLKKIQELCKISE